jgi:hypothetical protein
MRNTSIPEFRAEASLYKTNQHYRMAGTFARPNGGVSTQLTSLILPTPLCLHCDDFGCTPGLCGPFGGPRVLPR